MTNVTPAFNPDNAFPTNDPILTSPIRTAIDAGATGQVATGGMNPLSLQHWMYQSFANNTTYQPSTPLPENPNYGLLVKRTGDINPDMLSVAQDSALVGASTRWLVGLANMGGKEAGYGYTMTDDDRKMFFDKVRSQPYGNTIYKRYLGGGYNDIASSSELVATVGYDMQRLRSLQNISNASGFNQVGGGLIGAFARPDSLAIMGAGTALRFGGALMDMFAGVAPEVEATAMVPQTVGQASRVVVAESGKVNTAISQLVANPSGEALGVVDEAVRNAGPVFDQAAQAVQNIATKSKFGAVAKELGYYTARSIAEGTTIAGVNELMDYNTFGEKTKGQAIDDFTASAVQNSIFSGVVGSPSFVLRSAVDVNDISLARKIAKPFATQLEVAKQMMNLRIPEEFNIKEVIEKTITTPAEVKVSMTKIGESTRTLDTGEVIPTGQYQITVDTSKTNGKITTFTFDNLAVSHPDAVGLVNQLKKIAQDHVATRDTFGEAPLTMEERYANSDRALEAYEKAQEDLRNGVGDQETVDKALAEYQRVEDGIEAERQKEMDRMLAGDNTPTDINTLNATTEISVVDAIKNDPYLKSLYDADTLDAFGQLLAHRIINDPTATLNLGDVFVPKIEINGVEVGADGAPASTTLPSQVLPPMLKDGLGATLSDMHTSASADPASLNIEAFKNNFLNQFIDYGSSGVININGQTLRVPKLIDSAIESQVNLLQKLNTNLGDLLLRRFDAQAILDANIKFFDALEKAFASDDFDAAFSLIQDHFRAKMANDTTSLENTRGLGDILKTLRKSYKGDQIDFRAFVERLVNTKEGAIQVLNDRLAEIDSEMNLIESDRAIIESSLEVSQKRRDSAKPAIDEILRKVGDGESASSPLEVLKMIADVQPEQLAPTTTVERSVSTKFIPTDLVERFKVNRDVLNAIALVFRGKYGENALSDPKAIEEINAILAFVASGGDRTKLSGEASVLVDTFSEVKDAFAGGKRMSIGSIVTNTVDTFLDNVAAKLGIVDKEAMRKFRMANRKENNGVYWTTAREQLIAEGVANPTPEQLVARENLLKDADLAGISENVRTKLIGYNLARGFLGTFVGFPVKLLGTAFVGNVAIEKLTGHNLISAMLGIPTSQKSQIHSPYSQDVIKGGYDILKYVDPNIREQLVAQTNKMLASQELTLRLIDSVRALPLNKDTATILKLLNEARGSQDPSSANKRAIQLLIQHTNDNTQTDPEHDLRERNRDIDAGIQTYNLQPYVNIVENRLMNMAGHMNQDWKQTHETASNLVGFGKTSDLVAIRDAILTASEDDTRNLITDYNRYMISFYDHVSALIPKESRHSWAMLSDLFKQKYRSNPKETTGLDDAGGGMIASMMVATIASNTIKILDGEINGKPYDYTNADNVRNAIAGSNLRAVKISLMDKMVGVTDRQMSSNSYFYGSHWPKNPDTAMNQSIALRYDRILNNRLKQGIATAGDRKAIRDIATLNTLNASNQTLDFVISRNSNA